MSKAVAHPTDSRLVERSRQHLVELAEGHGLSLRQNCSRQGPRIGRYAHTEQPRRMRKALLTLKTRVRRLH